MIQGGVAPPWIDLDLRKPGQKNLFNPDKNLNNGSKLLLLVYLSDIH
jgi:hypothetical protein